ncbi:MAG: C45 family autoproteolytic acyltransferase/hydrolase [Phycisphaeraceae bacterium]
MTDDTPTLELIELAGTPRRMGEAFGETCREPTHELYDRRLRAAIDYARFHGQRDFDADQILALARRCLPITEQYDPVGYEEFLGIARGAALTPEQLYVTQGLTDLRDVLAFSDAADPHANVPDDPDAEGCSAFVAAADSAENGHLLIGQTWDLATDNMPYVRLVHRRPDDAPETISLTLTGCLSLIGLNGEGLATGNTNLRTRDARLGVQYLSILHRALRCRTIEEAEPCITDAPRAAAHYYYLADATDRAVGLECSATRCRRRPVERGIFAHCNHALTDPVRELEAPITYDSTTFRQQRLTELMENHRAPLGIDHLQRLLADREGGDRAINRYSSPPFDISTNAAVIMSPATRELHACRAQPDRGQWRTIRLS